MSEKTLVTPEAVQRILGLVPPPPISSRYKEKDMAFLPGEMRVLHGYICKLERALTQAQARRAEERDAALAEAAEICLAQRYPVQPHHQPGYVHFDPANVMAEKCAAAIRSLKEPR